MDPVEKRAFERLERAGEPPERARGVNPDDRLGVQKQRLEKLKADDYRVRSMIREVALSPLFRRK